MSKEAKRIFVFFSILVGVMVTVFGLETRITNHLGWILLIEGISLMSVGCLALGRLWLIPVVSQDQRDRSLWIPIFSVLAISLAAPIEFLFFPPIFPRNDHSQDIGVVLITGGILFCLTAYRNPDHSKDFDGGKRNHSRMCKAILIGIFLYPTSASLILYCLGIGVGYSSCVGILITVCLLVPGLFLYFRQMIQQN